MGVTGTYFRQSSDSQRPMDIIHPGKRGSEVVARPRGWMPAVS